MALDGWVAPDGCVIGQEGGKEGRKRRRTKDTNHKSGNVSLLWKESPRLFSTVSLNSDEEGLPRIED